MTYALEKNTTPRARGGTLWRQTPTTTKRRHGLKPCRRSETSAACPPPSTAWPRRRRTRPGWWRRATSLTPTLKAASRRRWTSISHTPELATRYGAVDPELSSRNVLVFVNEAGEATLAYRGTVSASEWGFDARDISLGAREESSAFFNQTYEMPLLAYGSVTPSPPTAAPVSTPTPMPSPAPPRLVATRPARACCVEAKKGPMM
eukprot:scaffold10273_cov122-Isochrysis_galbana.AAC.7